MRISTALIVTGSLIFAGVANGTAQESRPAIERFPDETNRGRLPSDETLNARTASQPLAPRPGPFMVPGRPVPPARGPVVRRRSVRDYSWIFIDAPQPHEVKVHDIVTIIVDEKSEVTVDSRFNRQRNGTLKAELREFIRFDNDGNLAPAALNRPKIDTQLQNRLQSTGQMADREGIRYRIAATVVDVLPNGNVVLEARKSIRTNWDVWEYSLTGVIRSADIHRDNTALSENIANLDIVKRQKGKVYSSTKRAWGVILYDWFSPF